MHKPERLQICESPAPDKLVRHLTPRAPVLSHRTSHPPLLRANAADLARHYKLPNTRLLPPASAHGIPLQPRQASSPKTIWTHVSTSPALHSGKISPRQGVTPQSKIIPTAGRPAIHARVILARTYRNEGDRIPCPRTPRVLRRPARRSWTGPRLKAGCTCWPNCRTR